MALQAAAPRAPSLDLAVLQTQLQQLPHVRETGLRISLRMQHVQGRSSTQQRTVLIGFAFDGTRHTKSKVVERLLATTMKLPVAMWRDMQTELEHAARRMEISSRILRDDVTPAEVALELDAKAMPQADAVRAMVSIVVDRLHEVMEHMAAAAALFRR